MRRFLTRLPDRLSWPAAALVICLISPVLGIAMASCTALVLSAGGMR
jgi:hypothetical protein